jgi:hypothetical protein
MLIDHTKSEWAIVVTALEDFWEVVGEGLILEMELMIQEHRG